MDIETLIEDAIRTAMGNLQINNIALAIKLDASEARVAELEAQAELSAVPKMNGKKSEAVLT